VFEGQIRSVRRAFTSNLSDLSLQKNRTGENENEGVRDDQPRKARKTGTYFVQNRSNWEELHRLHIQNHLLTTGMGGVLPEQPYLTLFRNTLDVGCGTGAWLIEVAKALLTSTRLIGGDASSIFIDSAQDQAEAAGVSDWVEFHTMDAFHRLKVPAGKGRVDRLHCPNALRHVRPHRILIVPYRHRLPIRWHHRQLRKRRVRQGHRTHQHRHNLHRSLPRSFQRAPARLCCQVLITSCRCNRTRCYYNKLDRGFGGIARAPACVSILVMPEDAW
jgi:SAM-dependent methyltransferase